MLQDRPECNDGQKRKAGLVEAFAVVQETAAVVVVAAVVSAAVMVVDFAASAGVCLVYSMHLDC